jgi:hypothetical protein
MDKNSFKDEDKDKLIEYLNFVASHAKFTVDVKQQIEHVKLLNYLQHILLPKINNHVLEVLGVHETKPEPKKPAPRAKKKG